MICRLLSQLTALVSPLQTSTPVADTAAILAAMEKAKKGAADNASSPADESLAGRQAGMRVMIVGDSMTQGAQGDWTWRYRIWEWFQDQSIAVDFVGPYVGTQEPDLPSAPSQTVLYRVAQTTNPVKSSGGYAVGVSANFDSHHFAVWGRAAAVDKGLIQDIVAAHQPDLMLLMLGFNDMGWFYSDAAGTLDSIKTLISNARTANPNLKFAVANVPQRTFITGREDLPLNTDIYNSLLSNAIPGWSTTQSPISLVKLQENYDCGTTACPAGYDGLHPNALGEYQIARAFTKTLVADFQIGTSTLAIPSHVPARPLPVPSNFQVSSSSGRLKATWDAGKSTCAIHFLTDSPPSYAVVDIFAAVYGAYNYDVQSRISGTTDFTTEMVSSNRWDARWPVDDFVYDVRVRASAGNIIKGDWTTVLSATAHPVTTPGPSVL
ncbi:uncharacterized protein PAC_07478 [Phialocephala subalpina]|uniref:Uncharacterized protein n=1 Tax=Phialocephala subalpina TaxID=576137 RepID=A0A1L7WXU8_9HELO|nr:uncharacterized protein PAC_07478 [Phialocephala subalpina]